MGVYQLLFIIEDQGILRQMYRSMLGVLIDYDQKHNMQLEETLYQYLKFDSIKKLWLKAYICIVILSIIDLIR